jgi:molecular chaperone GrpE (heat shock protein)
MFKLIAGLIQPVRLRFYAHGTAAEVQQKWLTNLSNATAEMTAGVARVTVAPGQAAASKKQKWINALMDTTIQDKWARNVQSVTLQQWQAAMNNYGINRVSQGAQAKAAKFQAAMASLLPFIDQLAATVNAMPDNTPADREARMLAMVRGMRTYQRPSS